MSQKTQGFFAEFILSEAERLKAKGRKIAKQPLRQRKISRCENLRYGERGSSYLRKGE
jgi:hypothetical protein